MNTAVAGPREAEVVSTRLDGAFQLVALTVPGPPQPARPGQFVLVPPEPGGGRVLPRTWWLTGAHGGAGHPTTLEVVLPPAELVPGDRVRLTGPLGRGFALPTQPVPSVVVGHELAQGPARWLTGLLAARGAPVHAVLTARDQGRHLDPAPVRRGAAGVVLTEGEDVGALVADLVGRHGVGVVYAVGPAGVVRAAATAAAAAGVVSQVAAFDAGTEAPVCGVGLCGACTVHVHPANGAGTPVAVRPCTVGPVLAGELLLPPSGSVS